MKKIYLIFLILTVCVVAPLYQNGYLFLLDFTVGPATNFLANNIVLSSSLPFFAFLKLLNMVIPTMLLQKIIMTAPFLLASIFMYRFARRYFSRYWALWSGLFYMLNPYVYERFLSGQFLVLYGYAVFPLVTNLFIRFLKNPDRNNFRIFTFIYSIYPFISTHWAYISLFVLMFIGLTFLIIENKLKTIKTGKFAACLSFFVLIFITVNSFWLFTSSYEYLEVGKGITLDDFRAFTTSSDPAYGPFFNALSLYGFWFTNYFLPKHFIAIWPVFTLMILGLSAAGFIFTLKKREVLGITLGIIFLPVLIVCVGFGSPYTAVITSLLYQYLPGFGGLRETGKVIGVLAFSYALLGGFGGHFIEVYFRRKRLGIPKNIFFIFILSVPFLISYPMWVGFGGLVKPHEYPASWYEASRLMKTKKIKGNVLFLPWYGRPVVDFADFRAVTNPAPHFFDFPLVYSSNTDNEYLTRYNQEPWDTTLNNIITGSDSVETFSELMTSQNISIVLLGKIHDWKKYSFLDKSYKLRKILELDELIMYKVI